MPVPAAITDMGNAAYRCGTFPFHFRNPHDAREGRSELTRDFVVYLELAMQAKHDGLLRGYCQHLGVQPRREDGTQVAHRQAKTAESALDGFYRERAATAAEAVRDQMASRWAAPQPEGVSVFTPGVRVDAAIQNEVQPDGFRYEISYWYEGREIYVLFHCYPAQR